MDSDETYIIYGSEYSPFSVKLRSYFRYKKIPHEWRPRTHKNLSEFQRLAKLPLIPLVVASNGEVLQDSTPIMELMESRYPERLVQPSSVELSYISFLLEDYGDEWVNKPMFHYRWWSDIDQVEVSNGLANSALPDGTMEAKEQLAAQIRKRMVPRLRFVGSHEGTKYIIEHSLDTLLTYLERHLRNRPYIFGRKPCFADFGIWGQLYSCLLQPTTKALIVNGYPEITSWIERMLDPEDLGDWEDWSQLGATLEPLLKKEVGELYLIWSVANAKSVINEETEFAVQLPDGQFNQQIAKYSARSLMVLKDRLRKTEKNKMLEQILLNTNCLEPLVRENW
jgi:glutathione S-transferase